MDELGEELVAARDMNNNEKWAAYFQV